MPPKRTQSTELFAVDDVEPRQSGRRPGRRRTGRHERALDRSVKAAGLDTPVNAAACSAARSLAWALDTAESKVDPYAIAQVGRVYVDALKELGLDALDEDGDDSDGFGGLDGPT